MRVLLDTHAFLWFYRDDPQLGAGARGLIEDPGNEVLLSLASCREMAIKCALGKLDLGEPFGAAVPRELAANDIHLLPIGFDHVDHILSLPHHHRDPFDRLVVAQAVVEGVPFLSNEALFDRYPGLDRRW